MRPPKVTAPSPMRTEVLLKQGLLVLALLVTAVLFAAAFFALGPGSAALPAFNSDSAVPVLMANGWRWDVFHAFYLGQDRFGAWPFLLAHLLAALRGQPVTPEFLHLLATLFLLAGAVPAALLVRPWPGLGLLAYTLAVLLPATRACLFEGAQPYSWQLTLLFFAWWCLRAAWRAEAPRAFGAWLCLSALLCFLATWTSSLSGPLLLGVTLLEGQNRDSRPEPPPRRRWALQLLPALFGMGSEALLRADYHRYIRATYQRYFGTRLSVDWGHFASNALHVWAGLAQPVFLAALAVFLLYVVALLLRRRAAGALGGRLSALQCTVLGSFLLALLPVPVLVLVRHVRMNLFAPRYFTPTYVFLVYGALVAVATFLPARRRGLLSVAGAAAGTLGLAAAALLLWPRAPVDPAYARQRTTARALAARAPGAVLLDGYWGTYVFAGLAPPGGLLALPRSGELNRTPEAEAQLAGAAQVLAGHRDFLSGTGSAPPWLFQYGTLLQRVQPDFFSDGVDAFSLYRPYAVRPLPMRSTLPAEGVDLEARGAELTLAGEGPEKDGVLAVELGCLSVEGPTPGWGEGPGGTQVPLRLQAVPGALFFSAPEDVPVRAFHLSFGRAPCKVRRARWYRRPD